MSVPSDRIALCLDVDNATLDTTRMHDQLALAVLRLLHINAGDFRTSISHFDPQGQGYRLDEHLQQYGWKLSEVREPLLRSLAAKPLLYYDAIATIQAAARRPNVDLHLITKGQSVTQNFELELVLRILKNHRIDTTALQSTVLAEDKGSWFARQCTNGLFINGREYCRIVLADDNPDQFTSISGTPGFIGLQIRRPMKDGSYRYRESANSLIRPIYFLQQALAYLDEGESSDKT